MQQQHRLSPRPPQRRGGTALTGMTVLAALMAALLLLSGCATPSGVEPQAQPLAPAALALDAAPSAAPEAQWWRAWGDPQLDALVARALADSPNLKRAQARLAQSATVLQALEAVDRPQVNGSVEATRQRYTENGLVPKPLAGSIQTNATAQLALGWELDFFGRHRAALGAALGSERAAAAELQAARSQLATQVVRSYVQLARFNEQKAVAQRTLAQRGDVLGLIQQRVQAGLDTNVELRQGEGALPDVRQQIEALDEQIALARHALATLTAQAPQALDTLVPALAPLPAQPLPAQLPADLLGRRADVAAARWRVEAASRQVDAARANFYPSVNLVAFAGFSAQGLDRLVDAGSRQYGVGPALRLPIFDAGRLRAEHTGRTAELDAAVEAYNAAVLEALREAADPIATLQSLQRQRSEQSQAQAAAESAYDLALQRYRAGIGSYLSVLTAETSVLAQRRGAADLKARALDAQAQLAHALGGGVEVDAGTPLAAAQQ